MMLPTNIRQKSSELFPNDTEKQRIFLMGAAFSLGNDLSDFEITTEQKQEEYYPCKEALEMWLASKKEIWLAGYWKSTDNWCNRTK